MIDTIGLDFNVAIDKSILQSWSKNEQRSRGHLTISHRLTKELSNGAPITYTFYPYVGAQGLLKVEFSLPHVVFGSNIYMIYDIEQAVNQANLLLPNIPGIADLNLWEGILYRLDVCYNHQVENLAECYLQALGKLSYPRRKTITYRLETVAYQNGQVCTKFYDKFKQSGDYRAEGILRQETTFRKDAVRRLLSIEKPILRDITIDILLLALENELKNLGLYGRYIAKRNVASETLCNVYGRKKGMYFYGLLCSFNEQPEKESICKTYDMPLQMLNRQLNKITDAGIPLTLSDSDEPLPPLYINRQLIQYEANNE